MEKVILVDAHDHPIGDMEKMEAHQKGLLHRAFSVFIFNSNGQLLLQRRASNKYHSPGLWTNTCCSHPRPGETTLDAAKRRLREEMGLTSDLSHLFSFTYHAQLDNELIEHELDHVFIGITDELPIINPQEVDSYTYLSLDELKMDIHLNPFNYTIWFQIILNEYFKEISTRESVL